MISKWKFIVSIDLIQLHTAINNENWMKWHQKWIETLRNELIEISYLFLGMVWIAILLGRSTPWSTSWRRLSNNVAYRATAYVLPVRPAPMFGQWSLNISSIVRHHRVVTTLHLYELRYFFGAFHLLSSSNPFIIIFGAILNVVIFRWSANLFHFNLIYRLKDFQYQRFLSLWSIKRRFIAWMKPVHCLK